MKNRIKFTELQKEFFIEIVGENNEALAVCHLTKKEMLQIASTCLKALLERGL